PGMVRSDHQRSRPGFEPHPWRDTGLDPHDDRPAQGGPRLMRPTLFGILTLAAIPAAVSALSPFPESATLPEQAAENTTIALQHIYSVQEVAIPGTVWGFLLLIGLAFLTISILLPERGELITGLLALAFITP